MHGKCQFFRYDNCLGQCSISVKRRHDQGNSYERQHLLINGLVYCLPGGTQAGMAAEAYIQIHRHQEERDTAPNPSKQPLPKDSNVSL